MGFGGGAGFSTGASTFLATGGGEGGALGLGGGGSGLQAANETRRIAIVIFFMGAILLGWADDGTKKWAAAVAYI